MVERAPELIAIGIFTLPPEEPLMLNAVVRTVLVLLNDRGTFNASPFNVKSVPNELVGVSNNGPR